MVSLTVYDGAMGIGGNKLYLEDEGKGVFLDFGKNFGKYSAFYEEFLQSRDTRGIHDLMYLDLLPKLRAGAHHSVEKKILLYNNNQYNF